MLLTAGGPFEEKMTVTNMWRFLEGVSKPPAKKRKVKLKPEPLPTRTTKFSKASSIDYLHRVGPLNRK